MLRRTTVVKRKWFVEAAKDNCSESARSDRKGKSSFTEVAYDTSCLAWRWRNVHAPKSGRPVDHFFGKYFSNTGGVPKHKVFSTPEARSGSSLLAFCSTLQYTKPMSTKPMSTDRSISKPRRKNSPSDWSKEKKQWFTEVVSFLLGPLAVYRGCYVLSRA